MANDGSDGPMLTAPTNGSTLFRLPKRSRTLCRAVAALATYLFPVAALATTSSRPKLGPLGIDNGTPVPECGWPSTVELFAEDTSGGASRCTGRLRRRPRRPHR